MFAEALGGKSGRGVKQAAIQLFADSPQPAVLKRNRVFGTLNARLITRILSKTIDTYA